MPTAVALRPRAFSELFDAAFLLARAHFRPLATLSAMVAIPAIALGVVNAALFGPAATLGTATSAAVIARTLPLTLATMCWYFVGLAALLHAASNAYLGEHVDPAVSLRRATARAAPIIGAHLAAYLAALAALSVAIAVAFVAGMALTFALGQAGVRVASQAAIGLAVGGAAVIGAMAVGVAVLARYATMSAVLMLEGGGAIAALRRSSALSAGHRWRIVGLFGILLVLSLVFSLTALGVGSLVGNAYVSNLVATILSIPLYPLIASVLTALYYDLRIRKEGFDIAHAARELGGAAPDAAA